MLTDDEYLKQRREIERRKLGIAQRLDILNQNPNRFEPLEMLISLNHRLVSCFTSGDVQKRRFILNVVGSNLVLEDQKLSIDARKPFRKWSDTSTYSELRAYLRDIRTFVTEQSQEATSVIAFIRQLLSKRQDKAPRG